MKQFIKNKKFLELIKEIDVSDSNYEKAKQRYNSIANYINNDAVLKEYKPDIYVQGSFRLGTAIKPLTEDGSYDIDLVCNFVNLKKEDISQFELKRDTGRIIKSYAKEHSMLKPAHESSRCWTLNYVDESNFHVDILPSVLNNENDNETIAITDKHSKGYNKISSNWEISNPKGYSEWFKKISKFELYRERYINQRTNMVYSKVEKIPDYKIKTDLQRVVQILKRHAEVMFEENIEYKPSSVIITTLSAKAYNQVVRISNDFEDLILNVIDRLPYGVEMDEGKPCIYNPVNKKEKLSNKWDKDNRYYIAFNMWLQQLRADFNLENNDVSEDDRMFYITRSLRRNDDKIGISLSNLSYHQKAKWSFTSIARRVNLDAFFKYKGFRYKKIKSGQAILKNGDLKFKVSGVNTKDYKVYWQITNTGEEARAAKCLRGDFYDSEIHEGNKIRKESTLYSGRHYVEVFLVKNDICEYKSNSFEINIIDGCTFEWAR